MPKFSGKVEVEKETSNAKQSLKNSMYIVDTGTVKVVDILNIIFSKFI